jgi:hypothetical protein
LENKRVEQVLPGSKEGVEGSGKGVGGGGQGGEVAQIMYTHMNKCKNNNKKKSRKLVNELSCFYNKRIGSKTQGKLFLCLGASLFVCLFVCLFIYNEFYLNIPLLFPLINQGSAFFNLG